MVSGAAVWNVGDGMDGAGCAGVKVVGCSECGITKCACMADARAPRGVVGTGSYIPERWNETYATADIIAYNGQERVKTGREFLLPSIRAAQRIRTSTDRTAQS